MKLVLTALELSAQAGDQKLKQKCIDWSEMHETEADRVNQSAEREEV